MMWPKKVYFENGPLGGQTRVLGPCKYACVGGVVYRWELCELDSPVAYMRVDEAAA